MRGSSEQSNPQPPAIGLKSSHCTARGRRNIGGTGATEIGLGAFMAVVLDALNGQLSTPADTLPFPELTGRMNPSRLLHGPCRFCVKGGKTQVIQGIITFTIEIYTHLTVVRSTYTLEY